MRKNYGMLIIDGKGDTGGGSMLDVLKYFSGKHKRKLYIINLSSPSESVKYNPFSGASDTIAKDMLINMTDWSEQHYKSNAERFIQRLTRLMLLAGIGLNFESIISNISCERFEMLSTQLAQNGIITKEEHIRNIELAKASGRITENAAARFTTVTESEIGGIFDENGIDIYKALEENAVIFFALNPLLYPEITPAMGRLILIDAKKAVSKLYGENPSRKFFIFDELNCYASTVLTDLINKSRSAGITTIPAAQSLADLEAAAGEAFKQQIIENCNNYIILRQNTAKSAEEWASTLGTRETMEVTYQIGQQKSDIISTGVGSAKKVRQFLYHPDEIKSLKTGYGIFMSKDTGKHTLLKVRKPF